MYILSAFINQIQSSQEVKLIMADQGSVMDCKNTSESEGVIPYETWHLAGNSMDRTIHGQVAGS